MIAVSWQLPLARRGSRRGDPRGAVQKYHQNNSSSGASAPRRAKYKLMGQREGNFSTMLLICACEPAGSLSLTGCSPLPEPAPRRPQHGTARVPPPLSLEMRPSRNSSKAVGAAADLSLGALVLHSSTPLSCGCVIIMKKDFSKVTLCVRSCSLAACDPAICLEQQCRTWLWYSEPESGSLGCFVFPNFYELAAFRETKIPRQELISEAPPSWCEL